MFHYVTSSELCLSHCTSLHLNFNVHFALGIKPPLQLQPIQHIVGTEVQQTEC